MAIAGLSVGTVGCNAAKDATQAQPQNQNQAIAVDVAVAKLDILQENVEYTGTTAPIREVAVRSRIEGRLLDLAVDVGDRIEAGQVIGQLDDAVLSATVLQAEAEVAAREAEVSQANASVGNARAQVERARLEYQQAVQDANRFTKLAKEGAVSSQIAETAVTRKQTLEQALRSAEQQVMLQEQSVGSSSQRVLVQEAIRLREQERQSYTTITAPLGGVVLERVSETGSLLFAGNEVVKLGDFSEVKVIVQVSELEIGNIRVNQAVNVKFDTLPNQKITGRVRRISPVADVVARLIPVEVVVPNRDSRLGSGQLARVQFASSQAQQIVIPETALEAAGRSGQRSSTPNSTPSSTSTTANPAANSSPPVAAKPQADAQKPKNSRDGSTDGKSRQAGGGQTATLFVVTGDPQAPKVVARKVTLGDRRDGKVAIRSGLQEGDRVVVRSGSRLKDGDAVRLSVLSQSL